MRSCCGRGEVDGGQTRPTAASIGSMTPEELKQRLDAGDDIFVLDVREPSEYQIGNLGGHLVPLNDLPKRVSELDASRETVVHCKMGGRSAKAVEFLKQNGFTRCITWTAGLMPGRSAWTPRCQSTEDLLLPGRPSSRPELAAADFS